MLRGFPEGCPPLSSTMLPLPVFLEYCLPGTLYKPFWGLWLPGPCPLWICAWDGHSFSKTLFFPPFSFPALRSAERTCFAFSRDWGRDGGSILVHSFPGDVMLWGPNLMCGGTSLRISRLTGVNPFFFFFATLPLEAEEMKYKQMALADALRAKVALVLLSLGFPQNLVWRVPLSCQVLGALKLICICIFIV